MGGMSYMHELADLPLPGFVHIMQPYWFAEGGDMTPEEFGLKAAQALEDKILELGADKVAAFIAEPIQGAGGVIIPPETYWPEIQRICQKYDVLLVADEVICGFGRTGHWFGIEYFEHQARLHDDGQGPDLGLYAAIGGDGLRSRRRGPDREGGDFNHGFTYSGHPVAAPWRWRTSASSREEKMVERVHDETGPYLDQAAQGAARSSAGRRGSQPRPDRRDRAGQGQGDAQAPSSPSATSAPICRDHCIRNGLMMRATRDTMLISPSLTWTKGHIDEFITIVKKSLDLTLKDSKSW